MQTPTPPTSAYASPKRKRGNQDLSAIAEPSPTRLKTTNLPSEPTAEEDLAASASPRTVVTGHFQNLDLDEHELGTIPKKLVLGPKTPGQMDQKEEVSLPHTKFEPDVSLPSRSRAISTPPPGAHGQPQIQSTTLAADPSTPIHLPSEIPETPQIHTVRNPARSLSASKLRSPPPSPPLWWSDAEITGHNPDPSDPMDDGYGINGVGFVPTPAMATARAERRRRQVKEWKERENREARAKRGERRRRRDQHELERLGASGGGGGGGMTKVEGRKVRFLEA